MSPNAEPAYRTVSISCVPAERWVHTTTPKTLPHVRLNLSPSFVMMTMWNAASAIAVLPIQLCEARLVRSEMPSNFVTILNRGPQRRGMRLITAMVAARVPISAHVAFGIVTKSAFTMRYNVVAAIWNLVAVPVK